MLKIIRRVFSFGDWSATRPNTPHPGDMLDAQFDEIIDRVQEWEDKIRLVVTAEGKLSPNAIDPKLLAQALAKAGGSPAGTRVSAGPDVDQSTWTQDQKDAFAADQNAMLWAEVSQDWAEHMPDTIPPNTLAAMGITGEHWSSRWWANRAAELVQSGAATVYIGDQPPNLPAPYLQGQLWWESDTGTLYVWYDDGNSSQWVEVAGTGGSAGGSDSTASLTPYAFDAVGDGAADDTAAIQAWLNSWSPTGAPLYMAAGVYRCTHGLTLPERVIIRGDGAPRIASFPQIGGDKSLLRPGYKNQIRGSALLFSGSPGQTFTTSRTDRFASIAPCVVYNYQAPPLLRDFAIIQDMDVLTAGGTLTTIANDNRATAYTAGLLVTCTQGVFDGLTVFGYFDGAGMIVVNKEGDAIADPDYNEITNCLITGGLAIIGANVTQAPEGLTGTKVIGGGIYGADHHNRADANPNIPALYIDGDLTSIGHIRGHTFTGVNFRTNANTAILFDHADDICLAACITEFSTVAGVPGLDQQGKIVGTANTQNVRMFGLAATADLGVADLIATVGGKVQVIGAGGVNDGAYFAEGGKGVAIYGDAVSGDSIIQLTEDFSSGVSGWAIRRDDDISDLLDIRYGGASLLTLDTAGRIGRLCLRRGTTTIASGAITVVGLSWYSVDTEGAAATDDLDTINGATNDGQLLYLNASNSSRDIVITEAGNIRLNAAGNFTLTNGQDMIVLMWNTSTWNEISRSDNTV